MSAVKRQEAAIEPIENVFLTVLAIGLIVTVTYMLLKGLRRVRGTTRPAKRRAVEIAWR
jgi:hypothetical protein